MQILEQQGMDISKHPRVILSLSYPDHGCRLLAFNLRLRLYLCFISCYFTVVSSLELSKWSTAFRNSYPAAIACSFHGKQTDAGQGSDHWAWWSSHTQCWRKSPNPTFGRICINRIWKASNSAIVIVLKVTVLNPQSYECSVWSGPFCTQHGSVDSVHYCRCHSLSQSQVILMYWMCGMDCWVIIFLIFVCFQWKRCVMEGELT